MEKIRQKLVGDLREVIVICCLSARWEEKGRMTREESYLILKKGMFKAEAILKILAEKGNL
jgi:hypothetical protein